MAARPYVIALEGHFQDAEPGAPHGPLDTNDAAHVRERLESFGGAGLKDRGEAGIDFPAVSHFAPSMKRLDAECAIRMAPIVDDRQYTAIGAYPTRFAGFVTIATQDPKAKDPEAAANEPERTVTKPGVNWAMIRDLTNGSFHDEPFFRPAAARLHRIPFSPGGRTRIASGNARRMLKI